MFSTGIEHGSEHQADTSGEARSIGAANQPAIELAREELTTAVSGQDSGTGSTRGSDHDTLTLGHNRRATTSNARRRRG